MKTSRKLLSLFLAAIMILGMAPIKIVFADSTEIYIEEGVNGDTEGTETIPKPENEEQDTSYAAAFTEPITVGENDTIEGISAGVRAGNRSGGRA